MLLEDKKTKAPGIYAQFVEQQDYESGIKDLLQKLKNQ